MNFLFRNIKLSLSILMLLGIILTFTGCSNGNGKYDEFAQCITQKGYRMYGLYTCSHCKDQKDAFGNSFRYIDYIECHPKSPDYRAQECLEAKIDGYPTWVGPNEEQIVGFSPLGVLAKETDCRLPE